MRDCDAARAIAQGVGSGYTSGMRFVLVVLLLCFGIAPTGAQLPPHAESLDALRAALPKDVSCEVLNRDEAVLIVPEPFAPPTFSVAPRYKTRTSRAVTVYVGTTIWEGRRVTSNKLTRRVVVHFEPDDRENALRVARVAARLMQLHRQLFKRETTFPRGASVADVWLIPAQNGKTDIGGETRDANVYIFAASTIKTPIELIRTVAHEWGHLTIPAARGFSEPESDAAGYLGERVYMFAMTFPLRNDPPEPYPKDAATLDALIAYNERQTIPLMKRYAAAGPLSPVLRGDNTAAMDYYIGMVLTCLETYYTNDHTVSLTGAALWGIGGEKPADFVRSLEREMAKQTERGVVSVHPPEYTAGLPLYVPLAKGDYAIRADDRAGTITFAGVQTVTVSLKLQTAVLRITKPGWYRISPTGELVSLIPLSFTLTRRKPNAAPTP